MIWFSKKSHANALGHKFKCFNEQTGHWYLSESLYPLASPVTGIEVLLFVVALRTLVLWLVVSPAARGISREASSQWPGSSGAAPTHAVWSLLMVSLPSADDGTR